MKIRKEELLRLIQEKFRDNQAFFADEIGISREYVNRLINRDIDMIESSKLCNKLITYCVRKKIDYKDVIILQ